MVLIKREQNKITFGINDRRQTLVVFSIFHMHEMRTNSYVNVSWINNHVKQEVENEDTLKKISWFYLVFKFILRIKSVCHIVHIDFIQQILKKYIFLIGICVKSESIAQIWNMLEQPIDCIIFRSLRPFSFGKFMRNITESLLQCWKCACYACLQFSCISQSGFLRYFIDGTNSYGWEINLMNRVIYTFQRGKCWFCREHIKCIQEYVASAGQCTQLNQIPK